MRLREENCRSAVAMLTPIVRATLKHSSNLGKASGTRLNFLCTWCISFSSLESASCYKYFVAVLISAATS